MVGYCFGASRTGEIVVLVALPSHEGRGIARHLLGLVNDALAQLGHKRLFLGCSSNPNVRSYGFYRHLGWRSTGEIDQYGDEVLEFHLPSPAGVAREAVRQHGRFPARVLGAMTTTARE